MITTRQQEICQPASPDASHSRALARRIVNYLRMRQLFDTASLQVDVVAGTAIVRGRAMTDRNRFRICECCRHVAGVYAVIDRMEVVAIQPAA